MPTYVFRDKKTQEITEIFMKISEREEFLKQNENLETIITSAAGFISNHNPNAKMGSGFKDLMKNIKKNNYGSIMKDY